MKQNSKKYLNVKYASNADILDCNSQGANGCLYSLTNSKLYKTGAYYFMGTSASNTELWAISPAGLPEKVKNKQYGMRTVITLDALTLTTGKTNGAWNIMK